MANIFSGLFSGGGGGSASSLQRQKDAMEQHNALMEYKRRNEDIIDQVPAYDKAIKDMTPERRNQMEFFRQQAAGRETGDKGLEAMTSGFKQRGGTISDNLKQDKDHTLDKLLWDYKQQNPDKGTPNKQIQLIEHFRKMWRADPKNDQTVTDAELARIALRQEQQLDLGPSYRSGVTGDEIQKKTVLDKFQKAFGDKASNDYFGYQGELDSAETFMSDILRKREDVAVGFEQADSSAGWWQMFSWLPESDALGWAQVKKAIVANIGMDKLLEMKASSAAGASGLGALSDSERQTLENIVGSLDGYNKPKEIKRVLRRLDLAYDRMLKTRKSTLNKMNNRNRYAEKQGYVPEAFRYEIAPEQQWLLGTKGAEPRKLDSELPEVVDDDLLEDEAEASASRLKSTKSRYKLEE